MKLTGRLISEIVNNFEAWCESPSLVAGDLHGIRCPNPTLSTLALWLSIGYPQCKDKAAVIWAARTNPINARWYEFLNEQPVKLTLRPNQYINWGYVVNTDEGWSSEFREWRHDGECVVESCYEDGVDCDGRLQHSCTSSCALHELAAGFLDEDGIEYPLWGKVRESRRDFAAEAAGY